jgi:hypothetical protein
MDHFSTLSDVIHARMAGGMGDVLLLFLDAGIAIGMGLPLEQPADPTMAAMLQTVIDRWYDQTNALKRQYEERSDPHLLADEVPSWLLSLPRQVIPPEGESL